MAAFLRRFDWLLITQIVPLLAWSLLTLKAVGAGDDYFFTRQIVWIVLGVAVMVAVSAVDWRFFASSSVIVALYLLAFGALLLLFFGGAQVRGAASWFRFSALSIQPTEAVKLILILMLAKYFSRRHIDIAHIRHIVISGAYAFIPTALILLQPDLGSAVIILAIWVGMIFIAGIRLQHFLLLVVLGIAAVLLSWAFLLAPYQKERITAFLNPALDPQGAGYNAIQSMVAVGSGEILGKGVGYGSQSRLKFLPESHTDFIFAAFAEEWGFVGIALLFLFLGIFIWRVLAIGARAPTNFGRLFSVGFSIMIVVQVAIHAGMNMGLLPITGITFPFLSYGGSHLIMLFTGIGILQNIYHDEREALISVQDTSVDAFV